MYSAVRYAQVVCVACMIIGTQRHASNNNILVGESGSLARRYARPSRESRDHNANLARTHSRLAHAHRHDNTLDIILKPLIESTQ